ncbi:arylsulfatase [Algoriphagus sp. PAP.12]|uniref:arylsulfatase n=1 Tax=Algoriphagus sp. PAP.12 TaxID=2996678 RepID=UPI00227B0A6C|nr:arylsulfatase [Algoriphagus sp. PAP.12]
MKNHSYLYYILFISLCGFQIKSEKPNIILIYADDLGIGLLGHEGQEIISTPNIDRLAKEGMRFERAYSNMLCAPARASLITGLHDSHQDGFDINAGGLYKAADESNYLEIESQINQNLKPIPENQVFLGQVAKEMGYKTAQIGKLEWGFSATDYQMKRHGWDYYLGYLDHVRAHGFYPNFLFENGKMVYYEGNTYQNAAKSHEPETAEAYKERWNRVGKQVYSQDIFMQSALNFIESNQDKQFFLYFPTQLPHGPVAIPSVHPDFANDPRLTQIEKEYASMVKLLDDNVGQILEKLEELGLDENTIVIFTADNGHEIYYGQKGRTLKPYTNMKTGVRFDDFESKYYSELAGDIFNGNGGRAGMKRSNLEGGINVPLIARWPNHIKPGATSHRLTANYDLLATIADLVGYQQQLETDGVSFSEELKGFGAGSENHDFVVYSSFIGPTLITDDGWKIRTYLPENAFELYNLNDDPREENNLAAKYPEKLLELKDKLLKACDGDFENGHYNN